MAQTVKNLPATQETQVPALGQEDPLKEGNVNPLQCSCLEHPMDRAIFQLPDTKSVVPPTNQSILTLIFENSYTHTHTHTYIHISYKVVSVVSDSLRPHGL